MTGVVVRSEKIDELPGHVRRSVGRQEQRRPGDILRLRPFWPGVGRDLPGGHISLDPAWIQPVDLDPVLAHRLGQ